MKDYWYVHGHKDGNHWLYRYSNRISLGYSKLIIEDKSYMLFKTFRNDHYYIDYRKVKDVKTYDISKWNEYHEGLGYYNLEYLNFLPEITFTDTFYSLVFLHNLPELSNNMVYPSGLITEYTFKEKSDE